MGRVWTLRGGPKDGEQIALPDGATSLALARPTPGVVRVCGPAEAMPDPFEPLPLQQGEYAPTHHADEAAGVLRWRGWVG